MMTCVNEYALAATVDLLLLVGFLLYWRSSQNLKILRPLREALSEHHAREADIWTKVEETLTYAEDAQEAYLAATKIGYIYWKACWRMRACSHTALLYPHAFQPFMRAYHGSRGAQARHGRKGSRQHRTHMARSFRILKA